jgi:hypothetical protein
MPAFYVVARKQGLATRLTTHGRRNRGRHTGAWEWEQLATLRPIRVRMPVGALRWVISGTSSSRRPRPDGTQVSTRSGA